MISSHSVKVRALCGEHPETLGVVEITSWDRRSRFTRALKVFGLIWFLVIPAFFIPVIHLTLAPLLFFAGPAVAAYLYLQKQVVSGGNADCPACRANFKIIRSSVEWPLHVVCSECGAFVRLEKAE